MEQTLTEGSPSQDVDIKEIQDIHRRMDIGYDMPNLDSPIFVIRKVFRNREGKVVAAAAVKLIGEAFLWIEPELSDISKATYIGTIADECRNVARQIGLEDVTAWMPPKIEEIFAKMLSRMGWGRSPWHSWSTRV